MATHSLCFACLRRTAAAHHLIGEDAARNRRRRREGPQADQAKHRLQEEGAVRRRHLPPQRVQRQFPAGPVIRLLLNLSIDRGVGDVMESGAGYECAVPAEQTE